MFILKLSKVNGLIKIFCLKKKKYCDTLTIACKSDRFIAEVVNSQFNTLFRVNGAFKAGTVQEAWVPNMIIPSILS